MEFVTTTILQLDSRDRPGGASHRISLLFVPPLLTPPGSTFGLNLAGLLPKSVIQAVRPPEMPETMPKEP